METVRVAVPPGATDAGLNEQLLSLGSPAQVAVAKLIGVLKPLPPVTITVVDADEPGDATVNTDGEKAIAKSGPGATCTVKSADDSL